jgi:acyl-CoA reductase-like NAD-dependent aldehyde dehydrogenase
MESSLIGYSRGDASAKTFQATNPANGEELPTNYAMASEEEVMDACRLANQASIPLSQIVVLRKLYFYEPLQMELQQSLKI